MEKKSSYQDRTEQMEEVLKALVARKDQVLPEHADKYADALIKLTNNIDRRKGQE